MQSVSQMTKEMSHLSLHIRLTFIGMKTGWAPKLSAGPLEKKILEAQLAPGEKMLSFVPDPLNKIILGKCPVP